MHMWKYHSTKKLSLKNKVYVLAKTMSILTTQLKKLMNGFVPWWGAREKHPIFMQMFIEALCKPGAVVIDVIASTGGFTISISIIDP